MRMGKKNSWWGDSIDVFKCTCKGKSRRETTVSINNLKFNQTYGFFEFKRRTGCNSRIINKRYVRFIFFECDFCRIAKTSPYYQYGSRDRISIWQYFHNTKVFSTNNSFLSVVGVITLE